MRGFKLVAIGLALSALMAGPAFGKIPGICFVLADGWRVLRMQLDGEYSQVAGPGNNCTLTARDRLVSPNLGSGRDQIVVEDISTMTLHPGTEMTLLKQGDTGTDWEITSGSVEYQESVAKIARKRVIKVRGTKTSAQAGGTIVPRSANGLNRFSIRMLETYAEIKCLEGYMTVDGQLYDATSDPVKVPYNP